MATSKSSNKKIPKRTAPNRKACDSDRAHAAWLAEHYHQQRPNGADLALKLVLIARHAASLAERHRAQEVNGDQLAQEFKELARWAAHLGETYMKNDFDGANLAGELEYLAKVGTWRDRVQELSLWDVVKLVGVQKEYDQLRREAKERRVRHPSDTAIDIMREKYNVSDQAVRDELYRKPKRKA